MPSASAALALAAGRLAPGAVASAGGDDDGAPSTTMPSSGTIVPNDSCDSTFAIDTGVTAAIEVAACRAPRSADGDSNADGADAVSFPTPVPRGDLGEPIP